MERSRAITALQRKLARLEQAQRPAWGTASSGCAALDRLLPPGGLRRGSLVEWLAPASGSGAATLAMRAAQSACADGGALVVVDRRGDFFPPAALARGVDPAQMIVVRPRSAPDELWAIDQALRCPAVAAVWAEAAQLDPRSFRRFQLAAEAGGVLGLLVRPLSVVGRPSWADVQLLVQPLRSAAGGPWRGRRWRVELLRCRGGAAGKSIVLELDETTQEMCEADHDAATHFVPLASQLADPAPPQRAAGA